MKQAGLLWKSYHYWAWMIFFGFLLPGVTSSRELDPAAVAFGSYPAVWGARISPDGQRIAYLRMHESDLPVAEVYDLENKKVTRIVASVKDEFDVKQCTWASDERLLCSFYSAHKDAPFIFPVTRLVGVDDDCIECIRFISEQCICRVCFYYLAKCFSRAIAIYRRVCNPSCPMQSGAQYAVSLRRFGFTYESKTDHDC